MKEKSVSDMFVASRYHFRFSNKVNLHFKAEYTTEN